MEFLEELYKNEMEDTLPTVETKTSINEGEKIWEQIKEARNKLKNNKTLGIDEILAEALKAGGDTINNIMHELINKI